MILIFFGPPGAGKGTQAKFVSKKLNIVHLSTGEILRNQLKKESKLSLELNRTIETGQLVSDKILNKIVLERIMQKDCNKGFIFDGYQRTITQALFIDDYLFNNNLSFSYFIEFIIDDDSIPSLCGYKKTHPLENTIEFYLTFNQNNKISQSDNQKKLNALIQTFQETCSNLIIIYSDIKKEAVLNL